MIEGLLKNTIFVAVAPFVGYLLTYCFYYGFLSYFGVSEQLSDLSIEDICFFAIGILILSSFSAVFAVNLYKKNNFLSLYFYMLGVVAFLYFLYSSPIYFMAVPLTLFFACYIFKFNRFNKFDPPRFLRDFILFLVFCLCSVILGLAYAKIYINVFSVPVIEDKGMTYILIKQKNKNEGIFVEYDKKDKSLGNSYLIRDLKEVDFKNYKIKKEKDRIVELEEEETI